jgi:Beta-glucosidase-related glycosidases
MKRISRIGAFVALAFIFVCGVMGQNINKKDPQMEKRIQNLIKKMTLKEKTDLLHGYAKFYVKPIPRLGIPEWSLSDGPHGVRAEINRHDWRYAGWTNDSATCFPPGTSMAASWNTELAYERGLILADEARFREKDVLLGPGVNIIRTPLCGRNFEYLSEDPFLNAELTVPYILALQSRDVAGSVKHYLANNQETERTTINVEMSERALREIYLPPFKAAVERGGVLTVMSAYNKFRGDWCSENAYINNTILREEMGFDGVIVTDWNAAHSTVKAALNGLDLEMGTNIKNYDDWFFADPLVKAVENGEVPESIVNEKVANVLRVMIRTKVLDPKKRYNGGKMNTVEHQQAAYRSAVEAAVLLKNENNILPIDINKIKSIAILGDNATRNHTDGGLSSEIKALYEITPLEAFTKKFGDKVQINYAQGYEKLSTFKEGSNNGQNPGDFIGGGKLNPEVLAEALEAAKKSDVAIIFAGLNHDYDTESSDKNTFSLPYGQVELVQEVRKVNPNTIVVIIAGSPVDMAALDICCPAIVWGWFGGMEAGNAIADVLTGVHSPSGKMPFTIPVTLEQSPAHALGNFPGRDGTVVYEEDIFVGYRWFDTKNIPVVYPFGYGLSYTTFGFGKAEADKRIYNQNDSIKVTFNLKNTGKMTGGEVVQLYVSDTVASVPRPAKELKAFNKVFLNPGESKEVTLCVAVSDLGFYDEKSRGFVVEPGEFILHLATSVNDIKQSISIEVL